MDKTRISPPEHTIANCLERQLEACSSLPIGSPRLPFIARIYVQDAGTWLPVGSGSTVQWLADHAADASYGQPVKIVSHPSGTVIASCTG